MKQQSIPVSALETLPTTESLVPSGDPRAPKADISTAPELFGDPYTNNGLAGMYNMISGDPADFETGDPDFDGGDIDPDDPTGDLSDGDIDDIVGDLYGDLYGDVAPSRKRRILRNVALGVGGAAAGIGAVALTKKAIQAIKAKRARRRSLANRVQTTFGREKSRQTIQNQALIRSNSGKINRHGKIPFFQLIGAKMNQSPIDPLSAFPADMLKYFFDKQAAETPFQQETALGVLALGVWTATATGVATTRYFSPLIVRLGINELNAAPSTIFTVTATVPTQAGVLTISTQPFQMSIERSFDVTFVFFPWNLVQNKPLPVIGTYNNANPVIVNVTGLPAASAVSLIVPGSLHPWVIALRNSIV
jgi:hypothetical protein